MNENDPYPVVLTQDEVEFLISFAVGQMPRSWIHTWIGKDRLKGEVARAMVTKRIAERFVGLQVRRRPSAPGHSVPATHPND